MFRSLSIYEGEKGDPYDLIIPFRRVEHFKDPEEVPPKPEDNPEDPNAPAHDSAVEVVAQRTKPAQAAGLDATAPGQSSAHTNITGGKVARAAGEPAPEVQSDHLPGGSGKLNDDGSVTDAHGGVHPVGERGTNKIVGSNKNKPGRTPADTDPASQHSPEKFKEAKDKIVDLLKKGAMALPILLPLSLLLAGIIQGKHDCDQIDQAAHKITSATSAATPDLSSSCPSFATGFCNMITQNKTKVDLTISPCVQFLSSDTVTISGSNVFDVTDAPIQLVGPCKIRIDAGMDYRTANTYSNTAVLHVKTNCADRMGYAIGQDVNAVMTPTVDAAGGLLSGLAGGLPWGTILMVLAVCVGIYISIQLIQAFMAKHGS